MFTILQRYHENEIKLKMVGLDLIQVTCFICWIACVDGQALYEEKCKIKIDQDVQQLYGKFFSTFFPFQTTYIVYIKYKIFVFSFRSKRLQGMMMTHIF